MLCSFPINANEFCSSELVLGYSGDWPPYIVKDENEQVSGADFDILNSVMLAMGCQLKAVEVPINRLFMELEQGSVDVATGASKTQTRKRLFHYSDPYRVEIVKLMYDKKHVDLSRLNNLREILLDDAVIALNKDAWYGQEIAELKVNNKEYNLIHVDTLSTRLKLFANQRVDGFIADEVVSCSSFSPMFRKNIAFHPYVINRNDVHFIFSKKTTTKAFVERFNLQLSILQNTSFLFDIYRKHMSHYCFEMLSLTQNKH